MFFILSVYIFISTQKNFTVIEEFSNWIAPIKNKFKNCLDIKLKLAAFRLVTKQKNSKNLLIAVSAAYELPNDKEHFVGLVKVSDFFCFPISNIL